MATREEMIKCADDFRDLSARCRASIGKLPIGDPLEQLFGDFSLKDLFEGTDAGTERAV